MKKIVSQFEFAIAQYADPEYAKTIRPETDEEVMNRRDKELREKLSRLKFATTSESILKQ